MYQSFPPLCGTLPPNERLSSPIYRPFSKGIYPIPQRGFVSRRNNRIHHQKTSITAIANSKSKARRAGIFVKRRIK
jgi:hypothetical protein